MTVTVAATWTLHLDDRKFYHYYWSICQVRLHEQISTIVRCVLSSRRGQTRSPGMHGRIMNKTARWGGIEYHTRVFSLWTAVIMSIWNSISSDSVGSNGNVFSIVTVNLIISLRPHLPVLCTKSDCRNYWVYWYMLSSGIWKTTTASRKTYYNCNKK